MNEYEQDSYHTTGSNSDPYTYYTNSGPASPVPQPPKKSRKPSGTSLVAVALCCSLLSGALGAGGVLLLNRQDETPAAEKSEKVSYLLQGSRDTTVLESVKVDTGRLMTAAEVYKANVGSTVGITTSITTNYWGYQSTSAASGSGFILTSDGYILTNYHVIESSSSITVSLYNGDSYDAFVVGYDESSDIAVLKIDATDLVPVVLGDSDNLNVGDSVVAIGNPLGELTFSLTSGTISAMDREVTFSGGSTMNLLQTDCAINSGNSGGALFNLYGEVIGVTNAKYSGSSSSGASIDNIAFAIPMNDIRKTVQSIIEKGYLSKPYVGISVMDVSQETQQYGVPAGAAVQSVTENSPAYQAGLQKGDVITAVNGEAMTSSELVEYVSVSDIGDEIVLSVYRRGQTLEITVYVGEKIQSTTTDDQKDSSGTFPWGSGR